MKSACRVDQPWSTDRVYHPIISSRGEIVLAPVFLTLLSNPVIYWQGFTTTKGAFMNANFPLGVILLDYTLGAAMWTLIGRFGMSIFLPDQSSFFFMRMFVRVTDPMMRLARPITPGFLVERLIPLYVAVCSPESHQGRGSEEGALGAILRGLLVRKLSRVPGRLDRALPDSPLRELR